MKDCGYYQELISRLVDRELSAEEGEELAAHARECEDCRRVYTAFTAISGMLADSLEEPPEELRENVMAEVRRSEIRKKNRSRGGIKKLISIAAVAVLVIGVGAVALPRLFPMGSAAPDMAEEYSTTTTEAAEAEADAAYGESFSSAVSAGTAQEPNAAEDAGVQAPAAAEESSEELSEIYAATTPTDDPSLTDRDLIDDAVARSQESESTAEIVDVTGQGRGKAIQALLRGTAGSLPAGKTADRRFLLRYDVDGVSTQVLVSVFGEKVYYISLSGEESDMFLADCSWSALRSAIYG